MNTSTTVEPAVWIRGPRLRQRWDLPASTFYDMLRDKRIPAPEYPFGPGTPYWRMTAVLSHERQAQPVAEAA